MENKAIAKGFFYRMTDDGDDTLLAVERSNNLIPPTLIELSGFTKSLFYKDWGLDIDGDKKQRPDS